MAENQNLDPIPVPKLQPLPAPISVQPQGSGKRPIAPTENIFSGGVTPLNTVPDTGRFPVYFPNWDNEEMYAQGQSTWDKFANAGVKMLGLAGTTALNGTIGTVYGIFKALQDGKLSSFYNNPFMNSMDEFNKNMENQFANYYTRKESTADWYSPDNLLTANFWFDKVMKNLGFAAGAYLGGAGWASVLKAIGSVAKIGASGNIMKAAEVAEQIAANAPAAKRLETTVSAFKEVAQKFASNLKFADKGQRAVMSGLMTTGEAAIEALDGMNRHRDALIESYIRENGANPDAAAMEMINNTAAKVGNTRMLGNMMLLTATNYIQLPKIIGSTYKGEKALFNNAVKDINKVRKNAEGVYEAVRPTTTFGRIYKGAKDASSYIFSKSEAFEEGAQFAIGEGSNNYWSKGENQNFLNDFVIHGVNETLNTKEGMESLLIGGISGGIMQSPGTFTGNRDRKKNTAQAIQDFNKAYEGTFMKDLVENYGRAVAIQGERKAAIEQDDFLAVKNLEHDFMHTYVAPRVKYGRFDLINEELDTIAADLQTEQGRDLLKERGIIDENTDVNKALENISKMKAAARETKLAYETLNMRFGGLRNPDGTPVFSETVIDKMVYANSVIQDMDRRIPDLNTNLAAKGVSTVAVLDEITKTGKVPEKTLLDEVYAKIKEVATTDEDILTRDFNDLVELSLQRKNFINEYNDMKANPEKYAGKPIENIVNPPAKAKVKVKSKDGDEELEVDEDYMVMTVEGELDLNELYDFPTFKITKQNEDGTIEILAANGARRTVAADYFAKKGYKIGKVKNVQNNKTASYFIKHANEIVRFNFGKKRAAKILGVDESTLKNGYVNGRLRVDAKGTNLLFVYKDSKGKLQSFVLLKKHFVAQPGFEFAQFQLSGQEVKKNEEGSEAAQQNLEGKLARRYEMINKFVSDARNRTSKIVEELTDRKNKLKEIEDSITNARETGKDLTTKQLSKAVMKTIQHLGEMKAQVLFEIEKLEQEQFELEQVLPYYEDLLQNAQELPEITPQIVTDLKEDIKKIGELIDDTAEAIGKGYDLLDRINQGLETAFKMLKGFVNKIRGEYDMLPPSIAEFQDKIETYLGEEGAKQFIENNEGFTPTVRRMELEINDYAENLQLSIQEKHAKELSDNIKELEKGLEELTAEFLAKSRILDFFEGEIKRVRDEAARVEQLKKDTVIWEKLFKAQKAEKDEPYTELSEIELNDAYSKDNNDPLKTAVQLYTSTVTTSREKQPNFEQVPYLVNEEQFINNLGFGKIESPETIQAIAVHQGNEAELGLEGLVEYRSGDFIKSQKLNPMDVDNGIIIYVFVRKTDEGYVLIDKEGKTINTLREKAPLDRIVTSMAPSTARLNSSNETRYREVQGINGVKAVEGWKKIREEIFQTTADTTKVFSINSVSRGISQKNIGETNPLTEVLTTPEILASGEQVIFVSTTPTIDAGNGVSINFPVGRPYFKRGSTVEFVNNRRLTEKEAEVIHQVIVKLAKEYTEKGTLDPRLTSWLNSVIYWYSPSDNNPTLHSHQVYVKSGTLHFGAKDLKIPFTPESLADRKSEVLNAFLEGNLAGGGTFHHVSNKALKAKEKYVEITGVTPEGELQERVWNSYQEYLASPVYPDGTKREDPLPITTNVRKELTPTDSVIRGRYVSFQMDLGDVVETPVQQNQAITSSTNTEEMTLAEVMAMNVKKNQSGGQPNPQEIITQGSANLSQDTSQMTIAEAMAANIAKKTQPAAQPIAPQPVTSNTLTTSSQTTENTQTTGRQTLGDVSRIEELKKKLANKGITGSTDASEEYRRVEAEFEINKFKGENWKKVEAWFAKNLPQIPIEKVKHLLETTDGGRAWGKFSAAGISLYENALQGTAYHEAFEAVWKAFLTPEEQTEIIRDWRKTRKDNTSSIAQIKEKLADEFAEYVETGKTKAPSKAKSFFGKLWNFIKSIFSPEKRGQIEELFSAINSGAFATVPFNQNRISGEEYRRVEDFDYTTFHELMQFTTSLVMSNFRDTPTRKKRFSLTELSDSKNIPLDAIYSDVLRVLENKYMKLAMDAEAAGDMVMAEKWYDLLDRITSNWDAITQENKIYLKGMGIVQKREVSEEERIAAQDKSELFEDEESSLDDEVTPEVRDNSKNQVDYDRDIFTIDGKANATTAIKVLFNTLRDAEFVVLNKGTINETRKYVAKTTSIQGHQFVNFSKAFNLTLSKLAGTSSLPKMMKKLANAAKDYAPIYDVLKALSVDANTGAINYDNLSYDDLRLLIDFYKTMSKQEPISYRVTQRGEISFMSPSTKFGEIQNIMTRFTRNLKKSSFFKYNVVNKSYDSVPEAFNLVPIRTFQNKIEFLRGIGLGVDEKGMPLITEAAFNRLNPKQKSVFTNSVNAIHTFLQKQNAIFITGKSLQLQGPISALANVIVESMGDSYDSTFFNIIGERIQTYVLNNPYATYVNDINEAETLDEFIEKQRVGGTFSKGSIYLEGRLFDKEGNRVGENLRVGYVDGMQAKNTRQSAKLSLRNRFLQNFNINLNGWFIPITNGDKKTEWMLNLGNPISYKEIGVKESYQSIFRNYLKYEILTAIEDTLIPNVNLQKGGKIGKLRFFLDILKNQPRVLADINQIISKTGSEEQAIENLIETHKDAINNAVEEFINKETNNLKKVFENYYLINRLEGVGEIPLFSIEGLDQNFLFNEINSKGENRMTAEVVDNILKYRTVNQMINNIEMFKMFFGDPALFSDTFKRIPGATGGVNQTMHSDPVFNNRMTALVNNTNVHTGQGITLKPTDFGYTTFREHSKILVFKDIISTGRIDNGDYNEINEADGQSKITLPAFRQLKIRTAEWNDAQEEQYQYEMALMRQKFGDKSKMSAELMAHDEALLKKGNPEVGIFEVIKPKGFTQNFDSQYKDIIYFKTSTAPLIPSTIVPGSNDEKLLIKMLEADIDFAAVESALKVGIRGKADFYNEAGEFNNAPIDPMTVLSPMWRDLGIQVETQFSQGKIQTTLGSQLTKLASVNLMSGGVPVDYDKGYAAWNMLTKEQKLNASPLYAKIKKNESILEELTEEGYEQILEELGITENNGVFTIPDYQKVIDFLMTQARDFDDNTRAALGIDELTRELKTPLEAIPQYGQLKAVLYSLVDKRIASPKVGGINLVQQSSWGREVGARTKEKGKLVANSTYKFYTKEEPWIEISLPAWFKDKLVEKYTKRNLPIPTDEELMGMVDADVLRGIGFRIPTQELNSAEVFRVKSFLPRAMGNVIIVPAEITQKAGSDFDVDKLNTYLKNVTIDMKTKRIVKIKPTLSRAAARVEFAKQFEVIIANKKENLEKKASTVYRKFGILQSFDLDLLTDAQIEKYSDIINDLIGDFTTTEDAADYLMQVLEGVGREEKQLNDVALQAKLKEEFIKQQTRKSLENAYYDSLEDLITDPSNYERLIAINTADPMKLIRNRLNKAKYTEQEILEQNIETGEKKPLSYGYLISPSSLDNVRHNYITGKYGVGIAAIAQTTNAIFQKLPVILNMSRLNLIDDVWRKIYIGDGKIRFDHQTMEVGGVSYPTLSSRLNKAGSYISDIISQYINGFVDVAKDPFIMELGIDMRTAGLFLFMDRLGNNPEHTVFFMNQPIIKDFLNFLDGEQIGSLGSVLGYKYISSKWPSLQPGEELPVFTGNEQIPSIRTLEENIKFYKNGGFEKASLDKNFMNDQYKIFQEFMKYQAMSSDLFALVQGLSWDTAHMSDPELFLLKNAKYMKANKTLFTPASDILKNVFIGKMKDRLMNARDAIGKFIAIEHPNVRKVLDQTKSAFIDEKFFPGEKDFMKIASRINNSFINYVIQTKGGYNRILYAILINEDTSTVKELETALSELPKDSNFYKILSKFEPMDLGVGVNSSKAIKFKREGNDVFTRNSYIAALRELKEHPRYFSLYRKLVRHALIQNGVQLSPNSWANLIPNEDYATIVSAPIKALPVETDLHKFNEVGAFYRNAWKTGLLPKLVLNKKMVGISDSGYHWAINFGFWNKFAELGKKFPKGTIMKSSQMNEYMTYIPFDTEGSRAFIPELDGGNLISKKTAYEKGDPRLMKTYLYQLVRDSEGNPVFIEEESNGNIYKNFIYRAINAWGEGNKAQEYYDTIQQSKFDNNTFKVTEINPQEIVDVIKKAQGVKVESVLNQPITIMQQEITNNLPNIVKDSAKKWVGKEQAKTKIATQFIGDGGNTDSTTNRIKSEYLKFGKANTGKYIASDIVMVASNGNRSGAFVPVIQGVLQGAYKNIDLAIQAGASFVMDTAAHLKATANYNTGELALAEYLKSKGYSRNDETGVWSNSDPFSCK